MPVGDGTYAVCGANVDGKCDAGKLLPSPGERQLLNVFLHQVLPVATWDKSAKQWTMTDGTAVGRGARCRHHLDWNTTAFYEKRVAQFGDKRIFRIVEKAPVKLTKAEKQAKAAAAKEKAEKLARKVAAK